MFKFKVGDQVAVITGKDKGKKAKIEKVLPAENKLVIAGLNLYKRHRKMTRNQPAGIYDVTRPLPVSNVLIICPKCSKLTRVGFKIEAKNKVRFCKKCKGVI